jgi:hypothetical protein
VARREKEATVLFATLAVPVQSLREVERYTKAADQERMARQGMAAMVKGNIG